MNDTVTRENLTRYLELTRRALDAIEVLPPEKTPLALAAADFLLMGTSYFHDAQYYFEKGDYVTSFASVNYAHGYLDAGVRLGIFRGSGEGLFAFDPTREGKE